MCVPAAEHQCLEHAGGVCGMGLLAYLPMQRLTQLKSIKSMYASVWFLGCSCGRLADGLSFLCDNDTDVAHASGCCYVVA
jgi:hypothetical protein